MPSPRPDRLEVRCGRRATHLARELEGVAPALVEERPGGARRLFIPPSFTNSMFFLDDVDEHLAFRLFRGPIFLVLGVRRRQRLHGGLISVRNGQAVPIGHVGRAPRHLARVVAFRIKKGPVRGHVLPVGVPL